MLRYATLFTSGYAWRSEQKAEMMSIQDLVAMGSGMKPVIPPTYTNLERLQNICDIKLSIEVLTHILIR